MSRSKRISPNDGCNLDDNSCKSFQSTMPPEMTPHPFDYCNQRKSSYLVDNCAFCIWKSLRYLCCMRTSSFDDYSEGRVLSSSFAYYENVAFERKSGLSESLELDELSIDDVNYFSFEGENKVAKVLRIYDGIKLTILFKTFDNFYKWNCKLNNIDFYFLSGSSRTKKYNLKYIKNLLNKLLFNKVCKITCFEFDEENVLKIDIELPENMLKEHEPSYLCAWLVHQGYAYYTV